MRKILTISFHKRTVDCIGIEELSEEGESGYVDRVYEASKQGSFPAKIVPFQNFVGAGEAFHERANSVRGTGCITMWGFLQCYCL